MSVALIDSGLGLLPTAAWLRRLRPEVAQLLFTDPENAPWGPRSTQWIIERVVATADRAVAEGASVIVLPCNTASTVALAATRAHVGEAVPVVGTVPAIKPAAAAAARVTVWATAATTASAYQADLIATFAADREVTAVAAHGLADAIDRADTAAIAAAIDAAAANTPSDVQALVLGCTHYPLVQQQIVAALPPGVTVFDSAEAVARQASRMLGDGPSVSVSVPDAPVRVWNSLRPGELDRRATNYEAGRIVLGLCPEPEPEPDLDAVGGTAWSR